MKYKNQVERIMAYISKDSHPEIIKAMNINPKRISDSMDAMVKKGMSVHAAEASLKKMWDKAAVDPPAHTTAMEMDLMGFSRSNGLWNHKETGVIITDEQQRTLTFRQIERMVIEAGLKKTSK